MKADLPQREPGMLASWEKNRLYDKALERRKSANAKPFILHDGPPYANGHLHLGHALNKILKDMIVRAKTMSGFYAPYVPGWDCHGLPIELALMKELKLDKHKVDQAKFRDQARAYAQKFVDIQREEFKRMGILGEWENPYLTMSEDFKRAIVDCFERLQKKGFVYRGKKPVYWCSVDETALAEAEVEYENDTGPSIDVAFPKEGTPNTFFVIWTTTPWTLPANVAIAFNAAEDYVLFESALTPALSHPADGRGGAASSPSPALGAGEGRGEGKRRYILASKRLNEFTEATGLSGTVVDRISGGELSGCKAEHPWIKGRQVPLLPAGFVAMDTGTGLVHIAPGHGREDYVLGQQNDLPVLSPVDDRGRFTDEVPEWKGEHVFKANEKILEFLKEKGRLLYSGQITHSYPHCWRCHKPVIFRATEQWFLDIDKMAGDKTLRERLQDVIDNEVAWIPAYGQNRIRGMVAARPDWCLSRQRLWGTQIPQVAQGSGLGAQERPEVVPELRAPSPQPDIFDVWFESGVSWAAVLQSDRWPLQFPADMYLEGSDQHRGWFQTSLIPSVALENKAPYKSVLTHGFVMDAEGRPMSKSLGNVIAPQEIIKQYGADVLRLWVASSDYAGDVRLGPEILKGQADNYRKIRNTFRYMLGNLSGFTPARDLMPYAQMLEIDRWALGALAEEIRRARAAYDAYEFHRVASRLVSFCTTELSGFYLDTLKDRLYCDAADSASRRSARTALHHLADALIRLWAPILPFTCDEAWRALGNAEGVHLTDLPQADVAWVATDLTDLFPVRDIVLEALEKARKAGQFNGNLEARVLLHATNAAMAQFLKRYEAQLSNFLIVSQATLSEAALKRVDLERNGLSVQVEKSEGKKCARCWIYKTDIGVSQAHPDLCGRCVKVITAYA